MANDFILRSFPEDRFEALAMLYLQNQDLTGLTPEEILDKFYDAYYKIREHNRELKRSKNQN